LQEANGDELPTGILSTNWSDPMTETESTIQQPLPQSTQSGSSASATTTDKMPPASTSLTSNSVSLNALMEDLDHNMIQQGVSTVPKGHCSACSKPIIGQVMQG